MHTLIAARMQCVGRHTPMIIAVNEVPYSTRCCLADGSPGGERAALDVGGVLIERGRGHIAALFARG